MSFLLGSIWGHATPYISEDGAKKLPQFKYSGNDASICYSYFWSPLAALVTKYTPDCIAYGCC